MRFRVALAILLTTAAYVAAVLVWRQVFPFQDEIAQFLPEGAIAYVHVNLTPVIRRQIGFQISDFRFQIGEPIADALTTALRSPEVQELAVAWFQSEWPTPMVVVIIGQRPSRQSDIVPTTTVHVGSAEVWVMVARTRSDRSSASAVASALASQRRQPVQVFIHPRLLPIPALAAVTHLLPDVMAASGTIGRDGFILRSDGRSAWALHAPRPTVVVAPRDGALQLMGVPIREIWEQLELPFHRNLAHALGLVLPKSADALVDLRTPGAVIRLPWDPATSVGAADVLRALAARIWPSVHAGALVADPASIRVLPAGRGSWEVQRGDDVVAVASVTGGSAVVATRRDLLDEVMDEHRSTIRLSRGCAIAGLRGPLMMVTLRIHPQVDVSLLMDQVGMTWTACGRTVTPID